MGSESLCMASESLSLELSFSGFVASAFIGVSPVSAGPTEGGLAASGCNGFISAGSAAVTWGAAGVASALAASGVLVPVASGISSAFAGGFASAMVAGSSCEPPTTGWGSSTVATGGVGCEFAGIASGAAGLSSSWTTVAGAGAGGSAGAGAGDFGANAICVGALLCAFAVALLLVAGLDSFFSAVSAGSALGFGVAGGVNDVGFALGGAGMVAGFALIGAGSGFASTGAAGIALSLSPGGIVLGQSDPSQLATVASAGSGAPGRNMAVARACAGNARKVA